MANRIEPLKKLSFSDWKILILSSLLLPVVALSLKISSLKQTQKFLMRYAPPPANLPEADSFQLQEAQNIARMVNISARHGLYKANCLKQVLVLWAFLNRRKITSTLHIGVKKTVTQPFEAHSWLECAGTPLIDTQEKLQNFSSFSSSNQQADSNNSS